NRVVKSLGPVVMLRTRWTRIGQEDGAALIAKAHGTGAAANVVPGLKALRRGDDRSTFRSSDLSLDVLRRSTSGPHQFSVYPLIADRSRWATSMIVSKAAGTVVKGMEIRQKCKRSEMRNGTIRPVRHASTYGVERSDRREVHRAESRASSHRWRSRH